MPNITFQSPEERRERTWRLVCLMSFVMRWKLCTLSALQKVLTVYCRKKNEIVGNKNDITFLCTVQRSILGGAIYLNACMYIYTYVCVKVYGDVHVYTSNSYMHTYIHTHIYAYILRYCINTHVWRQYLYAYTLLNGRIYTTLSICIYIYICVCM